MNIILTGFMGTGKTILGRKLAKALSMGFFDTDELIEKEFLLSIPEIFEKSGEEVFRKMEREIVRKLAKFSNTVISTGGKTLIFPKNFEILSRNGIVITLTGNPDLLWERIKTTSRPLVKDKDEFFKIWKEREPCYQELPNHIPIDWEDEDEGVRCLIHFLTKEKGRMEVKMGERTTEVIFRRSILRNFPKEFDHRRSKFFICDRNGFANCGRSLSERTTEIYFLSGRERIKNLKNVEKLWKWLIAGGVKRDSLIISVGGGVVGDLSGFVSSTILRGVEHYHVPTTLLSMLDSCIGGKNGINIGSMKNAVGTISPTSKVFIDPFFLVSLSPYQLSCGLVEGIKAGLIGDPSLMTLIEDYLELIMKKDIQILEEVIRKALEVKRRIVEEDPCESSRRKILNLGHTFGHAVESFYNYKISHGEAVGIGIIFSLTISETLGFTDLRLRERVKSLLKRLGLRTTVKVEPEKFMEIMKKDKKSTHEGLDFVLLRAIGDVIIKRGIEERTIFKAFEEVRE